MGNVGKRGAYPWAFSMYPTNVFEDGAKNGALAYVFGKKTGADVISDMDRMWQESLKK